MSSPTTADLDPGRDAAMERGGATEARETGGARRRRWVILVRRWAPWVAVALAVVVLSALLYDSPTGEPLGPDNPGREGAQALAQVLADHGVDVQVVQGTTSLRHEEVDPGTTVLLTHTSYLDPDSGADLLDQTSAADRLVVVVPGMEAVPGEALSLDVDVKPGVGGPPLLPDCDDPLVRPDDRLARWDVQLEVTGDERPTVTACYPPAVGHGIGGAREGALVTFPATADRPVTTLVGFGTAMANEHVTEEAHAAVALRLLGGSPRLLWVVPQPVDAAEQKPTTLWAVLPGNMTAVVVLLAAAVLALSVWRGRRLGPVVTEPLPAVVHASETTRNRGRLYRQARDRSHALAALQTGTRRRLVLRLGLPAGTDPDDVVTAVADATGRPADQVRRTLTDSTADDDSTFVTTARELRSLEEGLHP